MPNLSDLLDAMIRNGYRLEPPSPDAESVDAVIASSPCPTCGNPMLYLPFSRISPPSYRAFSICTVCDVVEEF